MQRLMKQEQEDREQSKFTCRYLRDESINGEAAAVYATHAESAHPEVKSDGQIWISKSRGLPPRDEMDVDAGTRHQGPPLSALRMYKRPAADSDTFLSKQAHS
jgi:hypothetical protein